MTGESSPTLGDEIVRFRKAHDRVLEAIGDACLRVGRNAGDVTLIAVTKGVAVDRVRAAVAAGQRDLGENRVREAAGKAAAVGADVSWHLIGPLQSNKARAAVASFAAIDSVDSLALARRLDRLALELRPDALLPILLQVNVDADEAKHGWRPADLERDLPALSDLGHVRLDGVMTIGRVVAHADEARPTFVALRRLSERLRRAEPALGPVLSMGMSDDYRVAVEEGATQIRVGRALFGPRTGDARGHC
ncbi:MAG TPA: YggS family pyridoxal phosphate-dependent enzyme [Candidatus Limnocylindrales bacterium]